MPETVGVIVASGRGERLRPYTDRIPKPMMPILNVPAVEWHVSRMRHHGIREIRISVHHLADTIANRFRDDPNIVCVRETELTGPAGALLACRDAKSFADDDQFVVVHGDTYFSTNPFPGLLSSHAARGVSLTMLAVAADDARGLGVAIVNGDQLLGIERYDGPDAKSALINAGAYAMSGDALCQVKRDKGLLDFHDLVEQLTSSKKTVLVNTFEGFWRDIGTAQHLVEANMDALRALDVEDSETDAGNLIDESALISERTNITHSIVGPHVRIEEDASVESCVVLSGAKIRRGVSLTNSLVG